MKTLHVPCVLALLPACAALAIGADAAAPSAANKKEARNAR